MSEIIDVECRTLTPLDDLSTEQLTAETNQLWQQIEFIGNYGTLLAAQAGGRLNVIKSRLGHGQWEKWCADNLNFSTKKANRMMKLAEKMADENSIFSKTTTLSDIGISKVWALLGAPEEVAEEVISNPAVPDMSVREFQDEIKRLKEEKAQLEEEKDSMESWMNQAKDREREAVEALQGQIQQLEEQIKVYQETPAASPAQEAEITRLQKELDAVRTNLGKEREKAKVLKDSVEIEKEKAAAEAAEKASREKEAELAARFQEENRLLIESNQQAAAEIDRLQKLQTGSQDVAEFKVKSDMLQQNFLACKGSIGKVADADPALSGKMKLALKKVLENMINQLEV